MKEQIHIYQLALLSTVCAAAFLIAPAGLAAFFLGLMAWPATLLIKKLIQKLEDHFDRSASEQTS